MKKFLWSIVLLCTVLMFGCSALGEPASVTKTADNKIEWAFTQAKQHPEKLLIDVINSAQASLDVAIYSLTHPDVVAAIRDAKKRGVNVRVITDKQQLGGKSQTSALKILGSAGIPTKINTHNGLMHLKMVVADQKIATTGSFNYSKAASTVNDEVLVVLRDETVAKAFSQQFENMWNDQDAFESIELRIAQDTSVPSANEAAASDDAEETADEKPTAGCLVPKIKGNKNSKIYHLPGSPSYDQTTANVEYFCTEEEAQKAGYRKPKN
ncbi:phospholipase D-like domain-containing protein [Brevibacillus sp. B_LB10_24]|uniref:phospholipase D-like domain-containing protein n=1 Tax=Brevibacillus TaxID=55080 RepID=UPI0002FC2D2B|nr:phospholipase D-like domain-containing protein [Brevibacillus massiliensis]